MCEKLAKQLIAKPCPVEWIQHLEPEYLTESDQQEYVLGAVLTLMENGTFLSSYVKLYCRFEG